VARDRTLSRDELQKVLFRALKQPSIFSRIVRMCIYTGQRRGEVAQMRREWFAEDTCTIPAHISKNGRAHTFPITTLTRQVLAELPEQGALFPSRTEATCFSGWSKAKKAFDKDIGVDPYTLHDLRRTFASLLAELRTPPHVVEKLLNHVSGTISGVSAVYNRYTYAAEMKEALERYDSFLRSLTIDCVPTPAGHCA
jgi:integrase